MVEKIGGGGGLQGAGEGVHSRLRVGAVFTQGGAALGGGSTEKTTDGGGSSAIESP